MLLSEQIAKLIEDMLDEGMGSASIKRNDLAQSLGCVPSQVSYVISSRFTPERGYQIESRRGGGGYIRIVRVPMGESQYLAHCFYAVGNSIGEGEARAFVKNLLGSSAITEREAKIILSAISASSLERIRPLEARNIVRADIMRQILMALMK